MACERNDSACVKELLEESQAHTGIRDNNGETPIHCAAKQDSPVIIQVRWDKWCLETWPCEANSLAMIQLWSDYYHVMSALRFPHSAAVIIPSSPQPGPLHSVVLGGERAEHQRRDPAPCGLPLGPSGGCQSPVGRRGQVRCHWWQRLPHPHCHKVQRAGVSGRRDDVVVLSLCFCWLLASFCIIKLVSDQLSNRTSRSLSLPQWHWNRWFCHTGCHGYYSLL